MKNNWNNLEMAKKRDHKIIITDEAINKIPRITLSYLNKNCTSVKEKSDNDGWLCNTITTHSSIEEIK